MSNKSFNYKLSSTNEVDRLEMISPGCLPLITSIVKTPKLKTSHFSLSSLYKLALQENRISCQCAYMLSIFNID